MIVSSLWLQVLAACAADPAMLKEPRFRPLRKMLSELEYLPTLAVSAGMPTPTCTAPTSVTVFGRSSVSRLSEMIAARNWGRALHEVGLLVTARVCVHCF